MTITREQVADLQPGDVVKLTDDRWPGVVVTGPVTTSYEHLLLGPVGCLRCPDGTAARVTESATLTVVSRALYVNHPRTEPVSGDVVSSDFGDSYKPWVYSGATWRNHVGATFDRSALPGRLRLLVDGETGQVVQ